MHRCLEISDLICLILEWLEFNRSALLNVALTSKAFLEPALSVLWRHKPMHWADDLFRVVPNDIWVDQPEFPEEQRILELRRPLHPKDLDRYRFYKTKIKHLNCTNVDSMGTATRNWYAMLRRAFDAYYPGESYLPEPTFLRLGMSDEQAWYLYDLISQKLRLLTIVPNPCHISLLAMISTLPTKAPMLKHLHIVDVRNEEIFSVLLQSLPALKSLQSFHCKSWSNATITNELANALALLPHLSRLYCHPPSLSRPQHLSCNLFPSLRYVNLTVHQISSVARFFQMYMTTCPVQEFKAVIMHGDPERLPSDGLSNTLHNLAGGFYTHSLTSFTLTFIGPFSTTSAVAPPLGLRDFQPILSCGRLEVFSLRLNHSMSDFDDAASAAMASAWPRLRGLVVTSFPKGHPPTMCTLRTLSYLARGCPDLEAVTITFSPSTAPYHIQSADGNAVHLNLTLLNISDSLLPWDSATGVASFLSNLFPQIKHINIPRGETENATNEELTSWAAWEAVARLYDINCNAGSGTIRRKSAYCDSQGHYG
ncbi:hypothetical protein FIBSPDRAFT_928834 [Athelia psychrophila]|uniref:F-box domain-containing protein n=1 Tax=Athelia psychrophila TaxID=1759441 RepID=A0A166PI92_9AGAM|nr:hypothetical protein FIBSPDRAFT_928834 [Fibularhizoctonia sp. CBS 109695]